MPKRAIRSSQLIRPFGPGSIYTDGNGTPLIIAGLDCWFSNINTGTKKDINESEYYIFEPRISEQIGVDLFKKPPDFRSLPDNIYGSEPPKNIGLKIPAYRFPTWYRNTKTGALRKFNLKSQRVNLVRGERWDPVRFISVCSNGHIGEFPWKEWARCNCPTADGLRLTDSGGSDLSSVRVNCLQCPKDSDGNRGRSLSKTTKIPSNIPDNNGIFDRSEFQINEIFCPGSRPWLGENTSLGRCSSPLVGALINQLNLYFGKTFSAIGLPLSQDPELENLRAKIRDNRSLVSYKLMWGGGQQDKVVRCVSDDFNECGENNISKDKIRKALEVIFDSKEGSIVVNAQATSLPESRALSFRRSEFDILRSGNLESPDLVIQESEVPSSVKRIISKVNLIERLRETTVFCGFDRLRQSNDMLNGMPNSALNQLFKNLPEQNMRWLPASVVIGEGIYFELSHDEILAWQKRNHSWIERRYDSAFISRLSQIEKVIPPQVSPTLDWVSRFILTHTFSHLLLNQFVFECGYSAAALRERVFVSSDSSAPMSGILIYTAAGDSEGTLGGLVRLGRPEFFGDIVDRALRKALWCSADPVCSENHGGTGSKMANMAACHSCALLPETSCECFNHGLDRSTVVGTTRDRNVGFATELILKS